jgi:hypothetical protein
MYERGTATSDQPERRQLPVDLEYQDWARLHAGGADSTRQAAIMMGATTATMMWAGRSSRRLPASVAALELSLRLRGLGPARNCQWN